MHYFCLHINPPRDGDVSKVSSKLQTIQILWLYEVLNLLIFNLQRKGNNLIYIRLEKVVFDPNFLNNFYSVQSTIKHILSSLYYVWRGEFPIHAILRDKNCLMTLPQTSLLCSSPDSSSWCCLVQEILIQFSTFTLPSQSI